MMERSLAPAQLMRGVFDRRLPGAESAGEPASRPASSRGEHTFAQVYAQHFDLVWRSLRHLGVPAQVLDDAVQDVWLVVHRKLAEFDGRSAPSTWLFGICINVARSRRRARALAQRAEPLSDDVQSREPSPEHALQSSQAWRLVQAFLAELPELHRAIFVSTLLENFSPAETASATGVDVNTVYKRVRALRRSFQRRLARSQEER
jgi:RNA polymerase sigma-70 factor (ECF subfamily)